jgi:uncharacterized protein (DUF2147 family)
MKKTRPMTAGLALLAARGGGQARAPDRIEGDWLTASGDARVRIGPCAAPAGRLCGVIVWLQDPLDDQGAPQRDEANPDRALRSRPVIGLTSLDGFRPAGPGRWAGGRIYDPSDGKTYDGKLALRTDGALRVSGCVLVFCRTQTWRRIP